MTVDDLILSTITVNSGKRVRFPQIRGRASKIKLVPSLWMEATGR
jgi:hypothetical protein